MKILDEELHISHAGPKQVIAAASQAWKEMFPSDTSGRPIANRGIKSSEVFLRLDWCRSIATP